MSLDEKFLELLVPKNVVDVFEQLKRDKTDIVPSIKVEELVDENDKKIKHKVLVNKIEIAVGCDGIGHMQFEREISRHSSYICDKGKKSTYQFRPFKEIHTAKPPYGKGKDELKKAEKEGKIRTLSISTIRDTIFQKLLAKVVSEYAEKIFKAQIDLNSYGYRDGKSSKDAVKKIRRYVDEGYVYILDGDIKGFFDEINHDLLVEKMERFFIADNKLILRYLKRFIQVKKIPEGKSTAEKRDIGIPQGGVLSGLLANVFLFDFDLFVVNTLMKTYEFRYIRYADDFVLMFKAPEMLDCVFNKLVTFLNNEKLKLHPLRPTTPDRKAKYSEMLDLSNAGRESLDFLGFEISKKFLRIKSDNIKKFSKRISKTLSDIKVFNFDSDDAHNAYFNLVVARINKKITALEETIDHENGSCPSCKKLLPKRSWIGYFMMAKDVRQLRDIDTMIRTTIYRDYRKRTHGRHLDKELLLKRIMGIKFVTDSYYEYRSQMREYKRNHGKIEYCQNKKRYYDHHMKKIVIQPPCE